MYSYLFDIGERARKASRFIGHVRSEIQRALIFEKKARKITQQEIANQLGVHRSVVNRQIMGIENLTLRSVADLAWALDWDIEFKLTKPEYLENKCIVPSPTAGTSSIKPINNNAPQTGGKFDVCQFDLEVAA